MCASSLILVMRILYILPPYLSRIGLVVEVSINQRYSL